MVKNVGSCNDRVVFFDNLRFTLVVCVLLQHAAHSYIGMDWWPVNEKEISVIVTLLSAFLDAFTMPLLFYISGYFAVPTILKKGTYRFTKEKLKRLGLPWLVVLLTICPILPLVYHYTRNDSNLTIGYGELWIELLKNAAKFDVGIIPSKTILMANNQFYQRYMWYLSLLIAFFVIFAMFFSVRRRWFVSSAEQIEPAPRSALSTFGFMTSISLLTSILSFGVIALMFVTNPGLTNPEPLFSLGSIIQFRPSRLPFFIVYFILGIQTYKYNWIQRGRFPGHFKTWIIVFVVLLVPFLIIGHQVRFGPDNSKRLFGVLFFLTLNFLTCAGLGLFCSLAVRYWHRSTSTSRTMAANSYYLYLSHYPFVIAYQLLLYEFFDSFAVIKFTIVSMLSIASAWIVSQYIIRPYPRGSLFMLIVLFVSMVVTIHV